MKRVLIFLVPIIGGLLLLQPAGTSFATTCIGLPRLKPVHRNSGVVFVPSGDRIANAKVTVLEAGKEIAEQQTGVDGRFAFGQLRAGNYEIQVRVNVLGDASTQVVLVQPESYPKLEIAVNLSLTGPCSSFSLVNSKKFEAGLKPSRSL